MSDPIDFSSYATPATPPSSAIDFSQYATGGSGAGTATPKKGLTAPQPVVELGDLIGSAAKNLAKISGPNVLYEALRKVVPSLPPALGMPSSEEVMKNGLLTLIPEGEAADLGVGSEAAAARAAKPTPKPSPASMLEHPGVTPWLDAAKAEIMKIPGANFIDTALKSAKGFAEGAAEPAAAPAAPAAAAAPKTFTPGPPDMWGKTIPQPVYPGAPLPLSPAGELLQASALQRGAVSPPAPADAALGRIPVPKQPAPAPAPVAPAAAPPVAPAAPAPSPAATTAADFERTLNDALGGRALKPNVPLKDQVPGRAAATGLPAGFTPVQSSALKGFKYDAGTREFESITTGGQHYIHGDVSPEEADDFVAADSKGRAWQKIRENPLVAKVVNGKRIPVVKSRAAAAAAEPEGPTAPAGSSESLPPVQDNDLLQILRQSVEAARQLRDLK